MAYVVDAITEGFFGLVNQASRFWLPAVLNEIAKIPPSFCRGDGCSIFLKWQEKGEERLFLAATTRSERLSDIFDLSTSYSMDREALRDAARIWKQMGIISPDASLTGWVAAFGRPLVISNLHDPSELDRLESDDAPRPVWSDKSRGPGDHDSAIDRPFLCVPMAADGHIVGAIRVATTSRLPRAFDDDDRVRLQGFGDSLAQFLVHCGALARAEWPHVFRIWGAGDVDDLASRIADAVPVLFDVECCSFFLRDPARRFVLRTAGSRDAADDNFKKFIDQNRNRLFYEKGDGSKTALCIEHQTPFVLTREPEAEWHVESPPDLRRLESDLRLGSRGRYIDGTVPQVTCEFPQDDTRCILLVPVRDRLSTSLPAGVLRILSTKEVNDAEGVVTDMLSFAYDLAGVIGNAWRDDQRRRAQDELVRELTTSRLSIDEKIAAAASIACDAVSAGAVTIFIRDRRQAGAPLITKPEYSVLAHRYRIGHDALLAHHNLFKRLLPIYDPGSKGRTARTAWVARERRTLNLKRVDDASALARLEIRSEPEGLCEIAKAGPFLAVPVSIGPQAKVEGVIRAVRRRNSEHGSFSLAHEEILAACGNVLATLLSTLRWKAVVSFSTRAPNLEGGNTAFGVVKQWVELAGGEVLAVVDRSEGIPIEQFDELCRRADVGIVIATVDTAELLAYSVEAEHQQMWSKEHLRTKRIVLEMDGVRYRQPEVFQTAKVVNYSRDPAGIWRAHPRFAQALRDVLGGLASRDSLP